jgi:hypothetical protein
MDWLYELHRELRKNAINCTGCSLGKARQSRPARAEEPLRSVPSPLELFTSPSGVRGCAFTARAAIPAVSGPCAMARHLLGDTLFEVPNSIPVNCNLFEVALKFMEPPHVCNTHYLAVRDAGAVLWVALRNRHVEFFISHWRLVQELAYWPSEPPFKPPPEPFSLRSSTAGDVRAGSGLFTGFWYLWYSSSARSYFPLTSRGRSRDCRYCTLSEHGIFVHQRPVL